MSAYVIPVTLARVGPGAAQHVRVACCGIEWETFPLERCGSRLSHVLDLSSLELDEIAEALADQTDYEHARLIDPRTGEIVFWTSDTGIDGQHPIEFDDLPDHLIPIDPLPSAVWYRDMADFAEGISDQSAAQRLARALEGKGAFRRFRHEIHEWHPDLLPAWYAFRDVRAKRRAVEWLVDNSLVDDDAANKFLADNPDPELP